MPDQFPTPQKAHAISNQADESLATDDLSESKQRRPRRRAAQQARARILDQQTIKPCTSCKTIPKSQPSHHKRQSLEKNRCDQNGEQFPNKTHARSGAPDTIAATHSHRQHGTISKPLPLYTAKQRDEEYLARPKSSFHFLTQCFRIVCGDSILHRRTPLILDDPSTSKCLHPAYPALAWDPRLTWPRSQKAGSTMLCTALRYQGVGHTSRGSMARLWCRIRTVRL
ncbi:hypothetical protein BS50DRAFT_570281 [Corynespora cassiicola Philippines]|uniref:Uncharacterized protein n=1 Tax=Corynespora cassiicola Philippines TaxID=1448308 RepID=A0A2T2NZE4_CORCC|nr:hypothetical protein BS50DRAFT_570281 [Corynespora cassiicola Philippines]